MGSLTIRCHRDLYWVPSAVLATGAIWELSSPVSALELKEKTRTHRSLSGWHWDCCSQGLGAASLEADANGDSRRGVW